MYDEASPTDSLSVRKSIAVGINLLEEARSQFTSDILHSVIEEDWIVVSDLANELRVLDTKLILMKKILETMPG